MFSMKDEKKTFDTADDHITTQFRHAVIAEEDTRCGYWGCKPQFLQHFNNPKALLVFLCCFGLVQGVLGSVQRNNAHSKCIAVCIVGPKNWFTTPLQLTT